MVSSNCICLLEGSKALSPSQHHPMSAPLKSIVKLPPFIKPYTQTYPENQPMDNGCKSLSILPVTIVAFAMFALGVFLPMPTNQDSAHFAAYCVACIPITAMAASHDALRALPRSKYLIFCGLRLLAIALASYGTRCLLGCQAPLVDHGSSTFTFVAQAVHQILPRPALWAAGLPLEALPFPEASAGHVWMLCMLCSVVLGIAVPDASPCLQLKFLPLVKSAAEKGEKLRVEAEEGMGLAPSAVAFIIGCSLSALWISLTVIASWATLETL